jgi:hypothetical protein
MPERTTQKVDALERTVLELGAEIYHLKGTITKQQQTHAKVLAVVKGLKQILDDKGLVSVEDFEAAVELGQAIEDFNAQFDATSSFDAEAHSKKHGH